MTRRGLEGADRSAVCVQDSQGLLFWVGFGLGELDRNSKTFEGHKGADVEAGACIGLVCGLKNGQLMQLGWDEIVKVPETLRIMIAGVASPS